MTTIIQDIDGPLIVSCEPEFFDWANKYATIPQRWSYSTFINTGCWESATGLPEKTTMFLYKEFIASDHYPGVIPIPGAAKAIHTIRQANWHIATARSQIFRGQTIAFLDQHFGSFDSYTFAVHWEKAALVYRLGANFVIDDNLHILEKIRRPATVQKILFPSRVTRQFDGRHDIIILDAERQVGNCLDIEHHLHVCAIAWDQIVDIISRTL